MINNSLKEALNEEKKARTVWLEKEMKAKTIALKEIEDEKNSRQVETDGFEETVDINSLFNDSIDIKKSQEKIQKEESEKLILTESAEYYIPEFLENIKHTKKIKPLKTGLDGLDHILDGGLYPDTLVFVGAISSLGKTTLVLQIADNIAQQGGTALIFSLEMARSELMAKSISRLSFVDSGKDDVIGMTARDIMTCNYETIKYSGASSGLWDNETRDRRENLKTSIEKYKEFAGRVYIHESVGATNVKTIEKTVDRYITAGIKPVVFIDYMQIIAPTNDRKTDKQTLDETVLLLKQIARKYKIAIIAVSSFNRESYSRPVSMASFKESGAIEYSADVLIGLQLAGVEEWAIRPDADKKANPFDVDKLKSKYPRKIELKVLKNRNGATGTAVPLDMYSKFNYFEASNPQETEKAKSTNKTR